MEGFQRRLASCLGDLAAPDDKSHTITFKVTRGFPPEIHLDRGIIAQATCASYYHAISYLLVKLEEHLHPKPTEKIFTDEDGKKYRVVEIVEE